MLTADVDLTRFGERHEAAIDGIIRGTRPLVVWTAPGRGGKGAAVAKGIVGRALRRKIRGEGNGQVLLGAFSVGSFKAANEGYLKAAAQHYGLPIRAVGGERAGYEISDPYIRFFLYGGGDKARWQPVMGLTADLAWIDEATLCNKQFIELARTRLTYQPGSKMVLTQNASYPRHWIKEAYIDGADDKVRVINTALEDNIHLSPETIAEFYRNRHSRYGQLVLNEWVAQEGLVYHLPPTAVVDHLEDVRGGFVVIDPGIASVTAALHIVPRGDEWIVNDEYYWDTRGDHGLPRVSDAQHWENIRAKGWEPDIVIVDPADPGFIQTVRERGQPTWDAVKGKEAGIRGLNDALLRGDLFFAKRCYNLISEAYTHAFKEGTMTPEAGNDHALDCGEYFVATVMQQPQTGFRIIV